MNLTKTITAIYEKLIQFVPLFRVVWVTSAVIGIVMLMAISSGVQIIMSPFYEV